MSYHLGSKLYENLGCNSDRRKGCNDQLCISWNRKITVIINFFKKYLFIKNYLVILKVTPLKYNTHMPVFFPILETLLKRSFWYRQKLNIKKNISSIISSQPISGKNSESK